VKTELLTLLKGLRTAREAGFTRVEVNMDSQIILKKVQVPCLQNQPLNFIVKECQELIANGGWKVKLEYCYKEANRVGDHFADIGVEQNSPFVTFDSPPNSALPLLIEDVSGGYWLHSNRIE